jgi:hypothetical protein
MRQSHCCRPAVESLEERMPLSAGGTMALRVTRLALMGTVQGTWTSQFTIPDTGGAQSLQGLGVVRPLGSVQATGSLHTPGFIASGRTTGTLTLSDPKGSIILNLVGAMDQPGFSPPASQLLFTVASGTGQFARVSGSGTATLQELTGDILPLGSVPVGTAQTPVANTFTLTLTAGRKHR